jgi:glycogen debranching enzyme
VRRGEASNVGIVPFGRYFGSVDATPLWIVLLGEYQRTTGDIALVRELAPCLDAALRWIDTYGDRDGDGFVEYQARSAGGLANQGWKDSGDAIVDADGSLAEPPIALVEVQAYVYAAKKGAARLFGALGDPTRQRELEAEAEALRVRFERAFWMPAEGSYCLALDGKKRQLTVSASNAGHALFAGIACPDYATRTVARLMSEDLFSGWGIRTLSNREVRYNPVGYHLGTVWPHDNALIALSG